MASRLEIKRFPLNQNRPETLSIPQYNRMKRHSMRLRDIGTDSIRIEQFLIESIKPKKAKKISKILFLVDTLF